MTVLKRTSNRAVLCILWSVVWIGCSEETIPACGNECAEYQWTPETAGSVAGTITRAAGTELEGDGIGTICLGLYNSCPEDMGDARRVVGLFVSNTDLSDTDTVISFNMSPVPPGTYYFRAKLDDDESGCPMSGSGGDVVMEDCLEITVDTAGEAIVDAVLDLVVPF